MTGRCAGCGITNRNADWVRGHTRHCPAYSALHGLSPERCLDPEAEFTRWRDLERAAYREVVKLAVVREAERRRAEQAARWETPPDPLAEIMEDESGEAAVS